ncbi:MAG: guanylate kinase [Chitinispirillaceae bacterium]|jgi:guanylate kinase|nr:guanylate kinase [Chitinispirillaceae bacterium]
MREADVRKGKIIVFSAPSGAGKNTLIDHVRETVPDMVYSISATTRQPRPGEVDGRNYIFLSEDEFRRRIDRQEFAEWALVHGHYYGTPRSMIDATIAAGKHIIMDIDVAGKKKFDVVYPEAFGILILPPSIAELERRLRARQTDDEATIRLRLANAKNEIAFAEKEGKYEYTVINDVLDKAKADIVSMVGEIVKR